MKGSNFKVLASCRAAARRYCLAVPEFLCPVLSYSSGYLVRPRHDAVAVKCHNTHIGRHRLHTASVESDTWKSSVFPVDALPPACSGCGALSQNVHPDEAGYYSASKRLRQAQRLQDQSQGHVLPTQASPLAAPVSHPEQAHGPETLPFSTLPSSVCDRCHNLFHHHTGVPISHPSMESIRDTIFSSPHKANHIYHVLDASDFPLSLIPSLHRHLRLPPQRSLNRRSQSSTPTYTASRRSPTLTFIITRSDLLAPKKKQVDRLMPYLVSVLRDALGPAGQDVRLGNVRCVSSKRDWWTKEVKEDIYARGGGSWMVGKVNVGKSRLFQAVFPKGRTSIPSHAQLQRAADRTAVSASLLPPPSAETPFPALPLVSPLPGTTASPIRLPFGSSRGELIDLPGLHRSDLADYVDPSQRASLVMTARPKPQQLAIKPGQSLLLLDGLIRLTPVKPHDIVFLASPFLPLGARVTSTEKAIAIQAGHTGSTVMADGVAQKVQSAGRQKLAWDVTRARAGSIARQVGVEKLGWRVWGMDLLVESVGWVEVVAQVRKRKTNVSREGIPSTAFGDGQSTVGQNISEAPLSSMVERLVSRIRESDVSMGDVSGVREEDECPEFEVFSPDGKGTGVRRPMNAWTIGGYAEERKKEKSRHSRPRMSMKGRKKTEKAKRLEGNRV